jgi:anthranilate phosphoribosyltransferase
MAVGGDMLSAMRIHEAFGVLLAGRTLDESLTDAVFEELLRGELDAGQMGALLSLIQARGVTVDELVGAARAMRRHAAMIPIDPGLRGKVIDTCGTGGAPKTFNVSTIAAIVVAAAGRGEVLVAKHGNRSRSGRGSAEVLGALGVHVDAGLQVQGKCLRAAHVCFCFAIHHHPGAKHAAGVRKALGFPTIFNLVGPLTNPGGASRQLMGVFDRTAVEKMAEALKRLGSERAVVVRGEDGMDEITTTTTTLMAEMDERGVRTREFDAERLGVRRADRRELEVATLEEAVAIARGVLGIGCVPERGARREIVLLNAGAALWVAGVAGSMEDGMTMAAEAIDTSAAARTLETLVRVSRE